MQKGLDLANVSRRPDRRGRRSVGQLTVSSRPPFRRRLGSEACLAHSSKGASPLRESPRMGHNPFGTPRQGTPRLTAPRARLAWQLSDSRRTVMNHVG